MLIYQVFDYSFNLIYLIHLILMSLNPWTFYHCFKGFI